MLHHHHSYYVMSLTNYVVDPIRHSFIM